MKYQKALNLGLIVIGLYWAHSWVHLIPLCHYRLKEESLKEKYEIQENQNPLEILNKKDKEKILEFRAMGDKHFEYSFNPLKHFRDRTFP